MSDHFIASIEALQAEVKPLEEQIIKKKQLINMLCEAHKIPPIYSDEQLKVASTVVSSRGDEFFNKALNTSIKAVLSHRKKPASSEEILDGLLAGGYDKFPSDRTDA